METESANGRERRQSSRRKKGAAQSLRISFEERAGYPRTEVLATLMDTSEGGCRIRTQRALGVGSLVYLDRNALYQEGRSETWSARVTWCSLDQDGTYSEGLELVAAVKPSAPNAKPGLEASATTIVDHYEMLQLNPKADPETIHRVYRILAQRFHPDNAETGDEQLFRRLLEAYRVLSDPEQRAAYDVRYLQQNHHHWQIFDQATAMHGLGSEKKKRTGILLVLYTRRRNEPTQPAMTVHEIEGLLGCPKEHLEFGLWFLREKGFVSRSDNARFTITVAGVEAAEDAEIPWSPTQRALSEPQAGIQ